MKVMRCDSCGAPMTNSDKCEYCGSLFRLDNSTRKPAGYIKFDIHPSFSCCTTSSDWNEQFYNKLYGRSWIQ